MGRGIGRYAFGLLAVLCTLVAQAQETLGVPEVFQPQGSLWCWAAVSEAVIDYYYDTDVWQCDIVNWVRTEEGWGPADCCQYPGDPVSCDRVLDNLTAYAGASVRNILRHWNVSSERPGLCHPDPAPGTPPDWSCYAMPSPTPEGLQEEITGGKPFVIHRASGGGHFMVGRGFRRDPQGGTAHLVDIMDPAFGQGYQTVRYEQLIRDGWDVTLLTDLELPWSVEKLVLAGTRHPTAA